MQAILSFFFPKPELGSQGFGDLLSCIRDKNIPLQNIHFVVRNKLDFLFSYVHNPFSRLLT